MMRSILSLVAVSAVRRTAHTLSSRKVRTSIDQITGTKGAYTAEEDVHRVSFPVGPKGHDRGSAGPSVHGIRFLGGIHTRPWGNGGNG